MALKPGDFMWWPQQPSQSLLSVGKTEKSVTEYPATHNALSTHSTPSPWASRSMPGMLHSYSTRYSLLQSCQSKGCEWHPVNQVGDILANIPLQGPEEAQGQRNAFNSPAS